jgi:hypothetical protein
VKTRLLYAGLVARALYELIHYDVIHSVCGFGRIRERLFTQTTKASDAGADDERAVCDAVLLATCLYWKRVLCLQRAVCTTRLLRSRGFAARLVIGYREQPFFSHAWVEVGARVVNDSPVYRTRLRVLDAM